ncbi:MAG: TIGR04133 family radical SAM/SPASM protein [Bacteroidales bacterium]|nr:TIGR04133 family radical SAM/SPASM protein [Bacteroidales bacterium]
MSDWLRKYLFLRFKKNETKVHELNYLFWECTTRCNLNCLHCGSDCAKDSSFQDMPLIDFLTAIDTLKFEKNQITVVLTGGEPLLRNDLEACGRAIRKKGLRWGMVSNGYLYTAERQASLLSAGMGSLTFSLDGMEETHNWLRNAKQSYSRVMAAIDLAVSSSRLNFDVVTCVNQRNLNELPAILKLLTEQGVKAWRLFTIAPIGRAKDNPELLLTDAQFKELMEFIVASRKQKLIDVKFSCEGFTGPYEFKVRDGGFFCRAGINIGSVLIDGSISACPNIDRSFAQGNIYTDNLGEVWETRFQYFRNRDWARRGQCEHCSDFKYCHGNGMHLWHGDKENVLVCHAEKIRK